MPACSPTRRISSSGSVRCRPRPWTASLSPAPLTPPACAAADYTTLKQAKKGGDFDLARVRQLIREIGLTLAELDFDPQAYLTRSFCILELLATVQGDAKLLVQMHFLKAFGVAAELAARPVDAKAAQTRRELSLIHISEPTRPY